MARDWSETDQEKLNQAIRGLPKSLYKYSPIKGKYSNRIKEIIVDSKIWFSSPGSFNDPLDCRIPPDFRASALKIEQFWRRIVKEKHPNDKLKNHKQVIKAFIRDSLHPQKQHVLAQSVFKSLQKLGILCLTPIPNSMLMWSYYAESHTGICLKFNTHPQFLSKLNNFIYPLEVRYTGDFPNVNYYDSDTYDFVFTLIGTKALCWKHEQEWRIVLVDKNGKIEFPPQMLEAIILGMNTNEKDRQLVSEWNKERKDPLPIFSMQNKSRSFELDVIKLS